MIEVIAMLGFFLAGIILAGGDLEYDSSISDEEYELALQLLEEVE